MRVELEGVLPFLLPPGSASLWLIRCILMHFDFLETPPRSVTAGWPAALGPTQEALPSRSWLLESGLATQAVPPCLFPPLPRPILAQPGLVRSGLPLPNRTT